MSIDNVPFGMTVLAILSISAIVSLVVDWWLNMKGKTA